MPGDRRDSWRCCQTAATAQVGPPPAAAPQRSCAPAQGACGHRCMSRQQTPHAPGHQQGMPCLAPMRACAGDLSLPGDQMKAKLEQCIALPGAGAGSKPARIKLVANLQRHWQTRAWSLQSVELHREAFDTPFTGACRLWRAAVAPAACPSAAARPPPPPSNPLTPRPAPCCGLQGAGSWPAAAAARHPSARPSPRPPHAWQGPGGSPAASATACRRGAWWPAASRPRARWPVAAAAAAAAPPADPASR